MATSVSPANPVTGRVYAAVQRMGTPFVLPNPWRRIPCSPAFFQLPGDPQSLCAELTAEFSPEQLVAAGVYQIESAGPALRQSLREPGALVWALRTEDKSDPYDLVAGMQSVAPAGLSFVAPLRDHRSAGLLMAAENSAFVVFNMADLAVLWSLGVFALPAMDCTTLTRPQYLLMCRELRLGESFMQPLKLCISHWSPSEWTNVDLPEARQMTHEFHTLLSQLGHDDCQVFVTKPPLDKLPALRSQLKFLRPSQISSNVLEMLDESRSPYPPSRSTETLAESYAAAVRLYLDALVDTRTMHPDGKDRHCAKLRERLLQLTELDLVNPLQERASRTPDLLQRNQLVALAGVARQFHELELALMERSAHHRANGRIGVVADPKDLRLLMALAASMQKLSKGISPWKIPPQSTPASLATPGSQPSASLPTNAAPWLGRGGLGGSSGAGNN